MIGTLPFTTALLTYDKMDRMPFAKRHFHAKQSHVIGHRFSSPKLYCLKPNSINPQAGSSRPFQ